MTVVRETEIDGYRPDDREMLEKLQQQTFAYFQRECSLETGLIADKTEDGSPASVAATGFGLCAYLVAVEQG